MRAEIRGRIGPALAVAAAFAGSTAARAAGQQGPEYFPNHPLTTQDGKVIHFYDDMLKGKAVVVNLIYTHCTASCPLETARLAQVQRLLGDRVGKDIFFYSITLDPDRDSPEVLKAYAAKFHTGPGWLFLTGKKEHIQEIGKKLGLTSLTDAANRDGHQPMMMIGKDADGRWMLNSAVDNPRFLAYTITHFFDGFGSAKPKSYAEMPVHNVNKGEYLFRTKCIACHTVGKGDSVGPDLLDITRRRDRAWLTRYITAPDVVLASGDPIARELFAKYNSVRMPNLELSTEEAEALLPYIERVGQLASAGPQGTHSGH